jgi:hypothetical protein
MSVRLQQALAAFCRTSDHCAAIPAGTIEQYQLRRKPVKSLSPAKAGRGRY